MADEPSIPDRPTGPEEDAEPHRFEPRSAEEAEDDFVVSACACGWRGSSFPAWEDGYAEAAGEWERHASAFAHSVKIDPSS